MPAGGLTPDEPMQGCAAQKPNTHELSTGARILAKDPASADETKDDSCRPSTISRIRARTKLRPIETRRWAEPEEGQNNLSINHIALRHGTTLASRSSATLRTNLDAASPQQGTGTQSLQRARFSQ
ncbi:hypothetical protein PWT90_10221 [Aphanocladium album]|nr:hypothetical protein PWT90_10221 [Aphanocladium album]